MKDLTKEQKILTNVISNRIEWTPPMELEPEAMLHSVMEYYMNLDPKYGRASASLTFSTMSDEDEFQNPLAVGIIQYISGTGNTDITIKSDGSHQIVLTVWCLFFKYL